MAAFDRILSGIPGLDEALDSIRLGDNVVWQVPNLESYRFFVVPYVEQAIRDALRLNTKWLIISECRGREIMRIMEGASSGCVALTSIHAENVWELPDRIVNMCGDLVRNGFENDVYTFFDYAIKVSCDYGPTGIKRRIDQLCFFDRSLNQNSLKIMVKEGKPLVEMLPERVYEKFYRNQEMEFLRVYVDFLKTSTLEVIRI